MLVNQECLPCLRTLTLRTLDLSLAQKPRLAHKKAALQKILLAHLNREFRPDKVPAVLFTAINRMIKQHTGVSNAFKQRKNAEIRSSREIARTMRPAYKHTLNELLRFSVSGNSLDFFKQLDHSGREMRRRIRFTINNRREFQKKLAKARRIIFFADNAGEVFFDLPLLRFLESRAEVLYVVKSGPIQNDLTLRDLKKTACFAQIARVSGSGNDAVGIELATINPALSKALRNCDLIIAKGMGYYETFSELSGFEGKLFHLLMAKYAPVAESLGVARNSYVFIRR